MTTVKFEVRLMTKRDIPQVLDIWREVGYHEGTHTLYTWLEVDPSGFYVAVTDAGEVIAAYCAVVHHENLVFCGIYCVKKKYQGLGIGYKVWCACNEHIGTRNAALNSVPKLAELYRTRTGFPIVENEWIGLRYSTTEPLKVDHLSDQVPLKIYVLPFNESYLPLVLEYDFNLMGYKRELAIQLSCKEVNSRTYVAIKDGACVGFGCIKRSCRGAALLGPLYADDAIVAEVMLKKLILSLPQTKGFQTTTLSSNEAASELIQRLGCTLEGKRPRLYRNKVLKVDTKKVFAQFAPNFSPF